MRHSLTTRTRLLAAFSAATIGVVTLAACGSSSGGTPASGSAGGSASGSPTSSASGSTPSNAGPATTADVGVKVSGAAFGTAPTLTIPDKPAPSSLTQQVLSAGTGATLAKGELLVANYLGQTWAPKNGKPNVFDSSFARGTPAAFVIGTGQVIPGWDKTLVGKRLGSRVLITIPPADGYGSNGQASANISGTDTLVFVVDLIAAYPPGASAPGTAVTSLPSGLPKLSNVPGKEPKVLSTAGVKTPTKPQATLIVSGKGAKIDPAKQLVLELVEASLATGSKSLSTWQDAPQAAAATDVFKAADVLKGQRVGSRALVLLPPAAAVPGSATQQSQAALPARLLIVDVVGQF